MFLPVPEFLYLSIEINASNLNADNTGKCCGLFTVVDSRFLPELPAQVTIQGNNSLF